MATKTPTISHVKVLNKKYQQNKEYIMARLELTEEQYQSHLFETAEKYIKYHVWNDDSAASFLMQLPDFWAWFVNHWNMVDDTFFNTHFDAFVNQSLSKEWLAKQYQHAHRVEAITGMLPDHIIRLLFKWANGK